ncbi:Eco57I restriction-modification methylase domain-containing protein [Streptococcus lactarius]|uniref:Eco57I restriction-modification methylase domain-containing protein n=1 Tax=Streptococcus lactarius TaxID=684066 RepID=UPI00360A45D3
MNDDFYHAYKNGLEQKRFQAILGNPPYIRYQYLQEDQRVEQSEILTRNLMKSNKLINAWVSFTVACISCMEDSSRIGLVVPAELLQVKYSEDLRKFLVKQLNRCTIVTFDNLVFDDIEQEVVLLLGEKIANDDEHLIKIVPFENAESLEINRLASIDFMEADIESSKWTKYFLIDKQLEIIDRIKNSNNFLKFSDVATCEVGITTGNNKYFCINDDTVREFDLKQYCRPLIARSVNIRGVQFLKEDWEENVTLGARTYLLDLAPYESREFAKGVKEYIKWGEKTEQNSSYKTRIRDEWYKVPSVWSPDVFFLRRNYQFPKVMLNTPEVEAVSTDTMHRIKLKDSKNRLRLIVSYYTTVGLLFSELEGRSYGGGVLEILPSEVSKVMLPNIFENQILTDQEIKELFHKIDQYIRSNGNERIESLLDDIDRRILVKGIGMSQREITELRNAWNILKNRRLSRGK